ncbi:unnamed protein product [Dicrocoelium dendriticum]|nr:unnamed protein product [Dicrocoelium dendriticum]
MESAEIFLVGQSYRAPDRIDKRFLDPRHVFGEVEQVKNRAEVVSSLLKECKRKRKAEGYAEGDSLYRELRVSDFLHANDPLETLAKTNKIVFDLDEVKCHPLTTDAIKADMEDIQVLGKGEIRQILKWRKKILEALEDDSSHQADSTNLEKNCAPQRAQEEDTDEDKDDVEIEEEVQRLLHEEAKHHKKRLKRVRKAKMKLAERLVLKMEHPGDRIEEIDEELFSLSTVHDLVGLEKAKKLFGDTSQTGVDALVRKENTLALKELRSKYENEQRSAIEGSKRVHFERRGDDVDPPEYADDDISAKKDTRDDLYLSSNEEDDDEDDGFFRDVDLDHDRMAKPSQTRVKFSDSTDSLRKEKLSQPHPKKTPRVEAGQNAQPIAKKTTLPLLPAFTKLTQRRNPLLMDLDDTAETLKRKRKIQSWLESDEMKDLLEPVTLGDSSKESSESDSDDKLDSLRKKKKKRKRVESSQAEKIAQPPSTGPSPGDSHPTTCDPCGPESPQPPTQQLKRLRRPLTPEEKALALRLIRSAKSRRELIESNYHRMQFFEDPSELPDWFVDDERKHMRKPLPITKEELAIVRPTMGRSIKKVEEAKRRKKARMDKRLKRIRQKAEDIPDDVPEAEKWQQIKQMYQKANLLKKKRRPLHLIVNTKAGARNPAARPPKGAKVKIVDRRMKSDLRALQRGSGKGRRGTNNNKGRRKKPVQLLAHKPRRGGRVKRHRASGH